MEKQLENLEILKGYQNRQVVLNYYQDEDFLWKREGFHFKSIKLSTDKLEFINDESIYIITLKDFPVYFMITDFQNYFSLQNGTDRVEIYFPS
ncbi:hypothetical protein [Bacillus sp. Marseille-P3661]|uniref:hypothetical protein n=1 Tax=Bacillus sp. Marseille-P3661 TaxID=1936234 RepID=UPI000C84B0BD|nr:hypothetical protein [Bacillus sp. Marseille-P3661]